MGSSSWLRRVLVAAALAVALCAVSNQGALVNPLKDEVMLLTGKNYKAAILKSLDKHPAAVLFYKSGKSAKESVRAFLRETWNPLATQLHGIVRIGAIDCTEKQNSDTCKNYLNDFAAPEDANEPMTILIHPVIPASAFKYDGAKELSQLSSLLLRQALASKAPIDKLKTTEDAIAFMAKAIAVPKVLLFTDKGKVGALYNALAHSMGDRMSFGIMLEAKLDGNDAAKKLKVKKIPGLIVKKQDASLSPKGVAVYSGDFSFRSLHEWLNVHAETFVRGGGFSDDGALDPNADNPEQIKLKKPWLFEEVPQMTRASVNEVCLKKSRGLCAIYLAASAAGVGPNGLDQLDDAARGLLTKLKKRYETAHGSVQLHWSWLNLERETAFAKLFNLADPDTKKLNLEPGQGSFVLLNPHRKLRFTRPAGPELVADEASITSLIEKIAAGDGRFSLVRGNKLPQLSRMPADLADPKADPAHKAGEL